MATVIKFYRVNDPYGCFSNYSPHPVFIDGTTWPTTEHYFQAQKFLDYQCRQRGGIAVDILGRPTINPVIFYSGKISGYITWILFIASLFDVALLPSIHSPSLRAISYILFGLGLLFTIISAMNLGRSLKIGLPSNDTRLKTRGIYRISRNPMYIGFNLLTISAMVGIMNVVTLLLGIYSIIVYHFIILREEEFLQGRFGEEFTTYCTKVRRYL